MVPDITSLTLEQKIGQMCLFGFFGHSPSDEIIDLIKNQHVGNIIVFARNFRNAQQLVPLSKEIHSMMDIPPLIAIDQEGGVVTRITEGASLLPGNMAVAATNKPELAFRYGAILGRELRALGINLNLAPVFDVNHPDNPGIGVRSFGDNADTVTQYGLQVLKGLQSENIFATAKHFPGKGAAVVDTHLDIAVINKTIDEIESVDAAPFKSAIDAGIECVMTSHAAFPAFTGDGSVLPGTFSYEIMTDYLRGKLGFTGVLITDDLEMGAATKSLEFRNSILSSVKAGADIFAVCHRYELQKVAIETLVEAVHDGDLAEERVHQAAERVLELKRKFAANRSGFFEEDIDEVVEYHRDSVSDLTQQSVTIHDRERVLPLNRDRNIKILAVIPKLKEFSLVEELKPFFEIAENTVIDTVRSFSPESDSIKFTLPPDESDVQRVLEKARQADVILFCSYNAHLDNEQAMLLKKVHETGRQVILFMMRNPFDRELVPADVPAVAVYAPMYPSVEAGIRRIFEK